MWILGLLLIGLAAGGMSGVAADGLDTEEFDSSSEDDVVENEESDINTGLLLEGDNSVDSLEGSYGPDLLSGEGADDTLYGSFGLDVLLGSDDDDYMHGGADADLMSGGDGDDSLHGGHGNDILMGDGGEDTLRGADGDDTLIGADVLSRDLEMEDFTEEGALADLEISEPAVEEADVLNGGYGDDYLLLGEGDIGIGGRGDDVFEIGYWVEDNAPVIEDFNVIDDVISIIIPEDDDSPVIEVDIIEPGDMNDDGEIVPLGETVVTANGQVMVRIVGAHDGLDAESIVTVSA